MNAEEQQPAIEPVAVEAEAGSDAPVGQSLPTAASADHLAVDGDASDVQVSTDSGIEQDAVSSDQLVVAETTADDAAEAVAEAVAEGLAEGVVDAEAEAGQTDAGADAESDTMMPEGESSDAAAVTDLAHLDESVLMPVQAPVPQPVHVIALNEKYPAAAGHRAFWREAGYECRAVIQNANVTVSCKRMDDTQASASQESQPASDSQAVQESPQPPQQPPQSPRSQAQEILLRRRFVSQGEAVAFMEACLAFDPNNAAELGFDEVGRII